MSTPRAAAVFAVAAVVTLAAGVVLERGGEAIAMHLHLSGFLFGSTVLAAATALPEVSTGLASVRRATTSSHSATSSAETPSCPSCSSWPACCPARPSSPWRIPTDIYLTGLGALLTVIYIFGIVFRPARTIGRVGLDSAVVLLLYLIGIAGLLAIAVQ